MDVSCSAFGQMTVTVDGTRQVLTRRRERGVLAVLLVAHGEPVAAERLVAEVWGGEEQTLAPLQVTVSRLRNLLEPNRAARTGELLVSTAAGYALSAGAADVDTWAFEASAEAAFAAGTPDERLRLAEVARATWTGQPYAQCEGPSVEAEAGRLQDLLLGVHEIRARALLDLGRPEEVVLSLAELAPHNPYRERLWSFLALAQYQSARQADALDTLRRLRERLADDLGVDPSEEVRDLERGVLRQDSSLAAAVQVPAAPTRRAPSRTPARHLGIARLQRSVGREAVVEHLLDVHRVANDERRAACVLVAGEAGIGKTRLVEDFAARATEAGSRVAVGRCVDGDYAPALWPWLDVVRSLVDGDRPMDPLLSPLLHGAEPVDRGAGSTMRMFDAVVDLVGVSATGRPLLVVIEDLHWADATSLSLLRHLAGAELPAVTILCTRRTVGVGHDERIVDTMAALARAGAERIRLDGLGVEAVRLLLDDAIGPHDPRLDQVVSEATGGNPFFVSQYARLLSVTPDLAALDPARLPVPDGVSDVLRQRFARLPDDGVRLLASAAVLGDTVDPDRLAALTGTPVDSCLDLLDLASANGLLVERGSDLAFVHALARETLYAELGVARRMRLHDRAGRLAEQHLDEDPDAVAEIAHHTAIAAPLGTEQAERARTWLARAARVAVSRHAHAEALELWRGVLAHADPESTDAAEALCGAATANFRLGHMNEAQAELDRAVAIALRKGDWNTVVEATRVLSAAGAWSWRAYGTDNGPFVDALTAALPYVASAARARLLATLQLEYFYHWRTDLVDECGTGSLELARAAGDADLLREVLALRLIVTSGSWDASGRLALAEELLALEPDGELLATTLFHLGLVRWDLGDPDGADETTRRCAETATALRHSGIEIPLAWWRAARARDRDDADHAALIHEALEAHLRRAFHSGRELECLHRVRSVPVGSPVSDETVGLARGGGMALRALVAHAVLESGRPDEAYALLGEPAPVDLRDYSSNAGRALRLLVVCETGAPAEVREALAPLEGHLGALVNYGAIDHLGVVDHFVAAAYGALGDERAVETARSAVRLNGELGCLPWMRRSEALLARLESRV